VNASSYTARKRGSRTRIQFVWLYGLSWTAGFVDAVIYLALYHVFVANMTGNTVVGGAGLVENNWSVAFRRIAAIPLFVLGMLLSKCGIHIAEQRQLRRLPALLYFLEALLLGFFIIIAQNLAGKDPGRLSLQAYFAVLTLPAMAMGLQNATHTHFGPFRLHTTHVTGTLAMFADEFAQFLIWFGQRLSRSPRRRVKRILAVSSRQPRFRNAAIIGIVWVCYFIGAVMGALLKHTWQLSSLWVPVSFLVLLTAEDLRNPASLDPSKPLS